MNVNFLDYLENTVKNLPDKIAFADEEIELTFREVHDKARRIGSFLYREGFKKEPIVVFINRGPRAITSFLGVLYSNCYYVPIDEEMPNHRVDLILENLKPKAMICDKDTFKRAKDSNYNGRIYLYDTLELESLNEEIINNNIRKAIDTDPMYIVFTSGSTGVPKGVIASHRSVIDYVENLSEVLEFNSSSIFGNQAPLYFDACLKEIGPTLKFGATTYLIPKQYYMQPIKLIEYLNNYKINTICWVVSAFTIISSLGALDKLKPVYLRTAAFVSEVFPIKQFNIWREACPDVKFTNLYGPTEVTGVCCYYKVQREFKLGEVIPAGKPFRNTDIILLNENKEEVKEGEIGEVCVRGTCLTLGYFNDIERTKEVFIQNPLNKFYHELIYCTGDLGRFDENGDLIFISRKDHQIKHMGNRIELGEIETVANVLEGIRSCYCIFDKESKKIVLYYTGDTDAKTITIYLKERLPRYMVPNKIKWLEEMPLMPNGKVDRNKLREDFVNSKDILYGTKNKL